MNLPRFAPPAVLAGLPHDGAPAREGEFTAESQKRGVVDVNGVGGSEGDVSDARRVSWPAPAAGDRAGARVDQGLADADKLNPGSGLYRGPGRDGGV